MPMHDRAPGRADGPDSELDLPSGDDLEYDLQDLLGNQAMLEQLQRVTGASVSQDRRLGRARDQLNDDSLSTADRARTLLRYRNGLLPQLAVSAMLDMRRNEPDMPVHGGGDTPGMVMPLYTRLAEDDGMQDLMRGLSDRIRNTDPADLDIEEVWEETLQQAQDQEGGMGADASVRALQAMATLANYYKVPRDEHGQAQLPDGIDPELWASIDAAGTAMATSTSPRASVMGHGAAPRDTGGDFTSDRNFHFFSHAWLAAELAHNHDVAPDRARATSGFIGAQYELMPSSFRENSGNAGLKDILVNAEGAAWGTGLLEDPEQSLPSTFDGPALEDRSWEELDDFDSETQGLLDKAADLSVGGIWKSLF